MNKPLERFNDIHHHMKDPHNNSAEDVIVNLDYYCQLPSEGYYSIGVHPWSTEHMTVEDIDKAINELENKAINDRVVAIGECGFDRLRGGNHEIQEYAFRRQVGISEKLEKPLIIHNVRATDDLIRIKKELKPKQLWIIHGHRGKKTITQQLLSHGFALSLGKHYNAEAAAIIPEELKYYETDEG